MTTKAGGRTTATPQGTAAASLADTPAPSSREELLVAHEAARRRRNAAPLGGHDWEAASAEVGRIEIEIARLERTMDPPRV